MFIRITGMLSGSARVAATVGSVAVLSAVVVGGTGMGAVAGAALRAADLGVGGALAQQESSGAVTVQWSVTGSDPRLSGFTVRRGESGASTVVASVGPAVRSVTDALVGLPAGKHLVSYDIVAVSRDGELVSTTAYPPMVYRSVPGGPASIDVVTDGATVSLRWQAPTVNSGLLRGYRVQRRADPMTDFATVVDRTGSTRLTDRVPGLAAGVHQIEYLVTSLGSTADGGASDFSATAFVGVPSWPERISARMAFDGGSGVLEWTGPSQNPGLVTGFRVSRAVDGGGEAALATVGASVHRYVDSGLSGVPAGTFANYTVTALAGASGQSTVDGGAGPATLNVTHTPLGFAAAPKVVSRNGSVVATWSPPDVGGVAVAGYHVRFRPSGAGQWSDVPVAQVDVAARRATFAAPTGRWYEIQVCADDPAAGVCGAWSTVARVAMGAVRPGAAGSSGGPAPTPSGANAAAMGPAATNVASTRRAGTLLRTLGWAALAASLAAGLVGVAMLGSRWAGARARRRWREKHLVQSGQSTLDLGLEDETVVDGSGSLRPH
jgi:hypothetical protein